jgi:hypothetical protein
MRNERFVAAAESDVDFGLSDSNQSVSYLCNIYDLEHLYWQFKLKLSSGHVEPFALCSEMI